MKMLWNYSMQFEKLYDERENQTSFNHCKHRTSCVSDDVTNTTVSTTANKQKINHGEDPKNTEVKCITKSETGVYILRVFWCFTCTYWGV